MVRVKASSTATTQSPANETALNDGNGCVASLSPQTIVRLARNEDIASIIELDPIAKQDQGRRAFIANAVAAGQCWAAVDGVDAEDASALLGYGVLNQSFFEHDFIPLVMVKDSARRRGVASAIMRMLESQCQGGKLFTSTNTSNLAMRRLLVQLGFIKSGQIENLDDQDPELVFVKLRTSSGPTNT